MSRYRPIVREEFEATMNGIGFSEVPVEGNERAYQRTITNGPTPNRFAVRVFSSILKGAGVSRDCGGDAIRVHVIDMHLRDAANRPKIVADFARVYRTAGALENTKERCREAYGYVVKNHHLHCPKCNAMLAKRTVKSTGRSFFGCTAYPACNHTQQIENEKIAA